MPQCDDVVLCKDIVQCTTILTLFEPPIYLNGSIYAYVENLCNGHVLRYETDLDADNYLFITINQNLMPECAYRIWINNSETNALLKESFEVEQETVDMVQFGVFKMFDLTDYTNTTGYTSVLSLAS